MNNTKVAYVKSQGQSRNHTCHWTGCQRQVPPAMWGCRQHWFRLPKSIRDAIWKAYRPGQEKGAAPVTDEYIKAARAAEAWIAEQAQKEASQ